MKKFITIIVTLLCILLHVEILFAGSGDFNADSITDILWRNTSTGQVNLWFMNADGTRSSSKTLLTDISWTVAETGDVNNNGIADIFWRQASTGKVNLWFMNVDGSRASARTLITDPSWTVAGTGDFNADGKSDVLWRQASTGKVTLWFLNADGSRASAKTLITDASWTVAGTCKFNTDAITDILWRQASTGKVTLWLMNADGTRASARTLITDASWTVAGTGYFNSDNVSDILWRQASTGKVTLWLMNADGTRASAKTLITDASWTVAGTGNINADSITDIFWRQASTGKVTLWFMKNDGTRLSYKTLMTDMNQTIVPLPLPSSTPASGSLDTTFGGDGIVTTALGSGNEQANAVAIQTDGKIVVAGYSSNGSNNDFAVVRYNTDGSPDATFGGGDGIVTTPVGSSDDYATAIGIQSDGNIVVAGYSWNGSDYDFAVVRYNTVGNLDTTFDSDGKVTTPVGIGDDQANAVAIQSDGKIVVAGYSWNGSDYDFAVVRYNTGGSLDTTFDSDGKIITPIGSGDDQAYAMVIQSDGKIIVAGQSSNGSDNDFAAARYNTDGNLDTTFGGNDGIVVTSLGGDDYARAVAVQPDNKIVVGGCSDYDFALIRYDSGGNLDTTFGGGDGIVITPIGSGIDIAAALTIQQGNIVMAGVSQNVSNFDFALVRYNIDGIIDTTFGGVDGKVMTPIGSGWDVAYDITIQPADGRIVVVGYFNNGSNDDFALVRYWP